MLHVEFYGVKMECDNPINANLEMFYSPLGNMTMCEGRMHHLQENTNRYSERMDLSTPVLIHALLWVTDQVQVQHRIDIGGGANRTAF